MSVLTENIEVVYRSTEEPYVVSDANEVHYRATGALRRAVSNRVRPLQPVLSLDIVYLTEARFTDGRHLVEVVIDLHGISTPAVYPVFDEPQRVDTYIALLEWLAGFR